MSCPAVVCEAFAAGALHCSCGCPGREFPCLSPHLPFHSHLPSPLLCLPDANCWTVPIASALKPLIHHWLSTPSFHMLSQLTSANLASFARSTASREEKVLYKFYILVFSGYIEVGMNLACFIYWVIPTNWSLFSLEDSLNPLVSHNGRNTLYSLL